MVDPPHRLPGHLAMLPTLPRVHLSPQFSLGTPSRTHPYGFQSPRLTMEINHHTVEGYSRQGRRPV